SRARHNSGRPPRRAVRLRRQAPAPPIGPRPGCQFANKSLLPLPVFVPGAAPSIPGETAPNTAILISATPLVAEKVRLVQIAPFPFRRGAAALSAPRKSCCALPRSSPTGGEHAG